MSSIINAIFPYLLEEDRYNLFITVSDLIEGNYDAKLKALGIKQSAYYQYKTKKLKINDDLTVTLLNLLYNKNQNKFNDFLIPLVNRSQEQLSGILDIIQPSPQSTPSTSTELLSTGALGFTYEPAFLQELISMISLPKNKEETAFPEIVLNFDGEKVWWGNTKKGQVLLNFGYFTTKYVTDCWGKGTVGFDAIKLHATLKSFKKYRDITFYAEINTKKCGIRVGDDVNKQEYPLIPIKNITNAYSPEANIANQKEFPKKLDAEYIPQAKEPQYQLSYGADVKISFLKMILDKAKEFRTNRIPFTLHPNPPAIKIYFENSDHEKSEMKLITKPDTLKVPPTQIEHIVSLDFLEYIVKNYKDVVCLRFTGTKNSAMYVLKKYNKGMESFVSGVLSSTK